MRFEIEIEEQITRRNSYFVEVEDEGEGEKLLNSLEDDVNDAIHPDDILCAIKKQGYQVETFIRGAEDVEYEIVN
ncbi:MAG: hypothetical protein ACLRMW_06380 [[Clostridium] symbiosum]